MAQVQAQEQDSPTTPASIRRGRIVRRYFLVFVTLVGGSLIAGILLEMGFRFQETRQSLELAHRQMAELAALRIRNYVEGVAQAVRLAAEPRNVVQGRIADNYIADLRDLLRNVPAIRDVVALDTEGREELRASRIGRSTPDTGADHSAANYFTAARKGGIYFGLLSFRRIPSSRASSSRFRSSRSEAR